MTEYARDKSTRKDYRKKFCEGFYDAIVEAEEGADNKSVANYLEYEGYSSLNDSIIGFFTAMM